MAEETSEGTDPTPEGSSLRMAAGIAWIVAMVVLWVPTSGLIHFLANVAVSWIVTVAAVLVACSSDRRTWIKRIFAATLSTTLLVGVLELAAFTGAADFRVLFGSTIPPVRQPTSVADPLLVYRRRPHVRLQGEALGRLGVFHSIPDVTTYAFDAQFDANGFRNDPLPETADVVVIGDSMVEGTHVMQNELGTSLLAIDLDRPVVNLAIAGYGPGHQVEVLRKYALGFEPRTVVWCFFEGNDLENVLGYDAWRVDPDSELRPIDRVLEASFVRNLSRAILRTCFDAKPSAAPYRGLLRTPGGGGIPIYFSPDSGDPLDESDAAAVARVRELFGEAAGLCAERDVRMLFVFVPTKYRAYHGLVDLPEDGVVREWKRNDLPEQIRSIVESLPGDVRFLDLTGPFGAAAEAGSTPYLWDDIHLAADGHRAFADAIAEAFRDNSW